MNLFEQFEVAVDKEAFLLIELAKEIDNLRQQWETPIPFYELMCREVGRFDIDVAACAKNSKCVNWIGEFKSCIKGQDVYAFQEEKEGGFLDWFYPQHGIMRAWCNPPYSNPFPWVQQALRQVYKFRGSVAYMLLNHSPSPDWYELAEKGGQEIVILTGDRVQFDHPCRDMNLEQFLKNYENYTILARRLGEDSYIEIVEFLHDEYDKVYRSANSTNAKCQCVIKFRARPDGEPCFVWHWYWKQAMEELERTLGEKK